MAKTNEAKNPLKAADWLIFTMEISKYRGTRNVIEPKTNPPAVVTSAKA